MPAFAVEMELRIDIVGEIVERQELLNGTQTIALEGTDPSGEWTMAGSLSWNRGLVEYAGEGDLTLTRGDGAEIFATLTQASVTDEADDAEDDHTSPRDVRDRWRSGAFDGASGQAEGTGGLRGEVFRGTWTLRARACLRRIRRVSQPGGQCASGGYALSSSMAAYN